MIKLLLVLFLLSQLLGTTSAKDTSVKDVCLGIEMTIIRTSNFMSAYAKDANDKKITDEQYQECISSISIARNK